MPFYPGVAEDDIMRSEIRDKERRCQFAITVNSYIGVDPISDSVCPLAIKGLYPFGFGKLLWFYIECVV